MTGGPPLDELMARGKPSASLDERIALASLEAALFDRPARPLTIARYVLAARLGEGANGLVYRAYDPELDRKVAVKLLQAASDGDGAGADRLLAEAQALARLSHPNVVTVHDVGSYAEFDLGLAPHDPAAQSLEIPSRGVFLVMEFVEGPTLAAWLAAKRRSWREVVDIFASAGRGLAAAHRAGLVHRDFKPANVIVGDDGRVRVLDFGLALAADDASGTGRRLPKVAGTLAYMAPEQHRGIDADARTDQYAFGVSLFVALTGQLPFYGAATVLESRKRRGVAGAVESLAQAGVPRHLRLLVAQCLAPEPDDRFASMDALIAALVEDPLRRRRRVSLVSGMVAVALALASFVTTRSTTPDPCAGVVAPMEQAWSDAKRARLQARFAGSGLVFAMDEWARVEAALDEYASTWADARVETCQAAQVREEHSPELLDRRVACLDRRLRGFQRTLAALERRDAEGLEQAMMRVHAMAAIEPCSDIDALLRGIEPPRGDVARAAVDEAYGQLATVRAELAAGHFVEAEGLAKELVQTGERSGYPPLIADAKLALVDALASRGDYAGAERELLDAVLAAQRGGDDPTAADAWIRLVWLVGVEREDTVEGETWSRFAEAAVSRLGDDPLRRAQLAHNIGGLRYVQGRYTEALTSYRSALDLQRDLLGARHPAVARTLNHMGNVLIVMEEFDRAYELCEQAGEIRRATLGERHPLVAATLNNLAVIRISQGRHDEAARLIQRSLEIVGGTGTPEELVALIKLADEQEARGEFSEARETWLRVEPLAESIHGPDHWTVENAHDKLEDLAERR